MDAKAIKTSLKEARDAIKNKDFACSLKLCKNILKSDKENYMALVFLGVSLQEIGPREQAQHAFRKAIQSNSDQPLAWNGLATFFEKDESDTASKELIIVYEKLLQTECEASKFNDLCTKLVNRALKIQEISKTANILQSLGTNEKTSDNNRRNSWLALATLLSQTNNLSLELMNLYEITLSSIIKDRSSVTCDFYKEYLKLLYKLKKYEKIYEEAINMHNLYESTIYPLEWISKIYVELSIEDNPLAANFEKDIDKFCVKMCALQSEAIMVIFANAVKLFRNKNYIDARDEITKVVSSRSGLIHAWVLYSLCHLNLYCFSDAEQIAQKADKMMQTLTKENVSLRNKINKILICSYARSNCPEKWNQTIELAEKILDVLPNDIDILQALVIVYINLNKIDKADEYLEKINTVHNHKDVYSLLKAKILYREGKLREALLLLQESNGESCEILIEIGTIFWTLKDYESSLVSFLKAAKLDPNYFMSFVHLGKYYEHVKDLDKARRCYQKAYKINPKCMDVGIGLSNILRLQRNWDANLNLLQNITGTNTNADVRWAWLQLGLHYLEQGDYIKSIESLRTVIRVEPNNGHYWECLADAYMARGAYRAAMDSYERAISLLDDPLYAKLQFAKIKFVTGYYDEAEEAFEDILVKNPNYVPALKGAAENHLAQSFQYNENTILGRVRSCAQSALNHLTTALTEASHLSCLWKLIADSCLLVANLPEKYSNLNVLISLAEGRNSTDSVTLREQQLHKLAARCYCKAINLTESNILLWYDLATCYYSEACSLNFESDKKDERLKLLNLALATVKHCICKNPRGWQHWNLLGVIAIHDDLKNYSLAQHAFIKATTIDKSCTIAWCNLGTLYLLLNEITLANKAYSQAQRSDPNYINSWIGQGFIAELTEHDDTMDLFRHSTQLSYHSQSAVSYGYWVCKTIIKAPPHAHIYSIHSMHAIPIAINCLLQYTERNPYDACSWNMLGILLERSNYKLNTLNSYQESLKIVDDKNRDKVLINYGRTLTKLQRYQEAISVYKSVKVTSFNDGCGLALALFKDQQYKESYEAYDTTMNWLAESENMQSHVLVALAAMMYLFKGADSAKTLLFQSTQLKPPSRWGLYATLALGVLQGDLGMAQLVLNELQPIKNEPDVIYHYTILQSLFYLRQDDEKTAIRSLLKSLHNYPDQAALWHFLSILLLRLDTENTAHLAVNCAQAAIKIGQSQIDITKILCIVSLATCLTKDIDEALKVAQKAVFCYPNVAENWAVLIAVLKYKNDKDSSRTRWLEQATTFVKNNLSVTEDLAKWFSMLNF